MARAEVRAVERLFGDAEPGPMRRACPRRGDAPLATRMRPQTLDEFVGQEHLLAAGSALRRAIEEGHPHSMILHGPPGSGKTTLARLVAAPRARRSRRRAPCRPAAPRSGR